MARHLRHVPRLSDRAAAVLNSDRPAAADVARARREIARLRQVIRRARTREEAGKDRPLATGK
jgi:hypothetical protein